MWQSVKNIYHLFNAFLANLWFGFPSRNLIIIGVTGTDGKTTTVNIIYHILEKSGFKVSMISTIGAVINDKKYDVGFHVTTPSSWSIQKFLKKLTKEDHDKKKYLILEVTSHALDQYRVWGIDFKVGVLTNVTHEHLDYHKNYEDYVKTKAKLVQKAKIGVINKDDQSYEQISKIPFNKFRAGKYQISKTHTKKKKWITYGMNKDADINPKNFPFETKIIGEFNQYNILAAIAACKALGLNDKEIRNGIKTFETPEGREEIVYDKDFKVMIDFAHTPNALKQILSTIKPKVKGRLIHIFGSAGERDKQKRPEMGRISSVYADIIIVTAEDPRSESIEKISEEIEKRIFNFQFSPASPSEAGRAIFNKNQNNKFQKDKKYYFKIPDRQEAIETAIKIARKGDFVLITGKGHEKSMNYGKGEISWSEHEAVKKALGQ